MFKECTNKEVVSAPLYPPPPPPPFIINKGSKLKTLWNVGRGGVAIINTRGRVVAWDPYSLAKYRMRGV